MEANSQVVCIFRSVRSDDAAGEYEEWSSRMDRLVTTVPGYIAHASYRDDASGHGVTISYFRSMEDLESWKRVPEHQRAQELGRSSFYSEYEIEVAEVVRHYTWVASNQ